MSAFLWIIICLFALLGIGAFVYFFKNKKKPFSSFPNLFKKQLPIVMLIGQPGVGKTRLLRQIKNNYTTLDDVPEFSHVNLDNLIIADTPGLKLDSSIDERENQINQFKKYFSLYKQDLSVIAFVVDYERTDLMVRKLTNSYKYFSKLNKEKIIIVTNWQLSENQQEDELALRERFKIYDVKNIFFIGKYTSSDEIIAQLKSMNILIPIDPLILNETLFEDENPEEAKALQNNLKQMTNQVHLISNDSGSLHIDVKPVRQ